MADQCSDSGRTIQLHKQPDPVAACAWRVARSAADAPSLHDAGAQLFHFVQQHGLVQRSTWKSGDALRRKPFARMPHADRCLRALHEQQNRACEHYGKSTRRCVWPSLKQSRFCKPLHPRRWPLPLRAACACASSMGAAAPRLAWRVRAISPRRSRCLHRPFAACIPTSPDTASTRTAKAGQMPRRPRPAISPGCCGAAMQASAGPHVCSSVWTQGRARRPAPPHVQVAPRKRLPRNRRRRHVAQRRR